MAPRTNGDDPSYQVAVGRHWHSLADADFALREQDVLDRDRPVCGRMTESCDHRYRHLHTREGPAEPVVKLNRSPALGGQDARADVGDADARSVSTQDDSQGRPVTLRVIVANEADTATTLVISRADGEKVTHIAWSDYLRLDDHR